MRQRRINVSIVTVLTAAAIGALFITFSKNLISKYTITFDTDGGTNIDSILGVTGTLVKTPADPTKEGYTFTGWVDKNNKTYTFDTIPNENITVTATWKINKYTISFDSKGGTSVSSITQDYATTVSAPTDPTYLGYTFDFWSLKGETTPYTFKTMPSENITLNANWTINRHDVTFILDGEIYGSSVRYSFNESIVLPTITKTGYTYDLWYTDAAYTNKISTATMQNEDITLYGRSSINSYDVTYHIPNKNDVIKTFKYKENVTLTFDFNEGYSFSGWFDNSTYTGTKLSSYKMPASNVDLYGKYNANNYTITLNSDGSVYKTINQEYKSTIESVVNPTKTGYTFAYWYTTDINTSVDVPTTMPLGGLTLNAKFTVNSHNLNYYYGSSLLNTTSVDYGEVVSSLYTPDNILGKTFAGWYSDASFANEVTSITMQDSDYNLYAKFTDNVYTVSFVNYDDTILSTINNLSYGDTITYTGATPTRPSTIGSNYTFTGWDNDITSEITGDTTFKAQYSEEIRQYSLSFMVDGVLYKKIINDYQSPIVDPIEPTKTGYTFAYWYLGSDDSIAATLPPSMPGENRTYTAKWTPISYSVKFNNYDGSELQSGVADYDTYATYSGETPTKPADAEYTYTFSGWDNDPTATKITGNTVFTAQFSSVKNQYSFTFVLDNGDSDVIYTRDYGTATPTITSPTKTGYTFAYWYTSDPATSVPVPGTITSNVTFTAKWTINSHSVNYHNGSVLAQASKTCDYGANVDLTLDPLVTGKTLEGWYTDSSLSAASKVSAPLVMGDADLDLYGKFTTNSYSLVYKYKDALGTPQTLSSTTALYDSSVDLSEQPVTGYVFHGWFLEEGLVHAVSTLAMPASDTVLYGKYVKQYTVLFKNGTDTLETDTVESGNTTTYDGATPTKASDAQYTYTFTGWDSDPSTTIITADTTFTAQFSSTLRSYTITFANANNGESVTKDVDYGTTPTYTGTPTKATSGAYSYTFSGWDKTLASVTGAETYTAQFTETEDKSYGLSYTAIDADTCFVSAFDKSHPNVEIPTQIDANGDGDLETVIGIGDKTSSAGVFANNSSLTSIKLPSTLQYIASASFSSTTALPSIEFPDSLQYVGDYAFYGTHITEMNFKSNVQYVGGYVIAGSLVEKLTFADGALATESGITDGAFNSSSSLKYVTLPNTLAKLSKGMFQACIVMESIIIPKSTNISTDTSQNYFTGCKLLNYVYIESTTYTEAQINSLKGGIPSTTTLYYYSATEKTDGNYWHYDTVTGLPIIWGA
jgi:uncharacterized repeat protein (TIGR02543 family)